MFVLIVEDEDDVAIPLVDGMTLEGYRVHHARDGIEAEMQIAANDYDVLIVDWMLPKLDGYSLVRQLRKDRYSQPIIMLTARTDVKDRVLGLDGGADDYVMKPFSFEELLARIRALNRRPVELHETNIVAVGPIRLDLETRESFFGDLSITLRPKEFDLLELLLRRVGRVVTRTEIAQYVWGDSYATSDNLIDVTVSGLRAKLKATASKHQHPAELATTQIRTLRGIGYRLSIDVAN